MGDTKIAWTDKVWNPVNGCSKVSEGCRNCYAENMLKRFSPRDRKFTDVQWHPERLDIPLHWRKPRRIFVNSISDLWHPDVPNEFIAAVFGVMAACPQHCFRVLTKRPERMRKWFDGVALSSGHERVSMVDHVGRFRPWPLPNVMLGVSVENQETADERIPSLLKTSAAKRFVSVEPILGAVDLSRYLDMAHLESDPVRPIDWIRSELNWVIVGGESGPKARPMHPDWARDIRDQCVASAVPFFFKQWGEWETYYDRDIEDPDWRRCPSPESPKERYLNLAGGYGFHGDRVVAVRRVGKKAAGRELDGKIWDQMAL